MEKTEPLFYSAYEDFYNTIEKNHLFANYCEQVFGINFSQDGFINITQVRDIIIKEIEKRDCI